MTTAIDEPPDRQHLRDTDARYERTKRGIDVVIAGLLLLLLTPLILLLMMLVALDSPGGALFRQMRVGRDGRSFTLYKLRTFRAEHHGFYGSEEIRWDDDRITRIGRVLRRSKLDELLQLLNVLRGEMTLVGPRPSMPEQVAEYGPEERIRLRVRPGLTGVTQVSGNTWLDWSRRISLDRWYVANRSTRLDLRILLATFPVLLRGERPTDDPLGVSAALAADREPAAMRESAAMKQPPRFARLQRAAALAPLAVNHLIGEASDALYVRTGGRLDATRPRRIYGLLNERCNLRCQGCQYWRLPAYAREMSAAQWIEVLAQLRDFLGRYHINFSGGEPLLRPDLFEILNYCRDNGIHAGLTTNGVILRERQARELVEARLFSLNVSIDGAHAATHDRQRGVAGSFDKAIGAIRSMQSYGRSIGVGTPIIIKPMVSALNLDEMPALVELAADLGCSVLFQPVSDWGTPETEQLWIDDLERLERIIEQLIGLRNAGHAVMNSAEQMRDWIRHFQRAARAPAAGTVKCTVGLDTLIIQVDGTLRHCYRRDPIGKVGGTSVKELWTGQVARQVRSESVACTRGCTESCTVRRPVSQRARGVVHLIRSG